MVGGLRLVLEMSVSDGNQRHTKHAAPALWGLLGQLARSHWPNLARGDRAWGSELVMARCEQEGLDSLLKLRMTRGVRRAIEKAMKDAGLSW